jgi:ABC-2 type transport system permease protein
MKLYRIKALIERALLITFRGIDPMVDFFYWPFYDILVWGFTASWLKTNQVGASNSSLALLTCLVLWQASYRANLDVSFNFLAELWARNIVNLFATPLKICEWIIASLLVGLVNTCIAVSFGLFAVWALYGVSILSVGWPLIPFFLSLILSGWAVGFFTASTLAYWGQKVQKLVWVMGWFFVPFSAVFYPLHILPAWAQVIAKALPMTYIFESVRSFVNTGKLPMNYLIISFVLNIIYFIGALLLFTTAFRKSRTRGLARLELE